jgi:hypothetical protein
MPNCETEGPMNIRPLLIAGLLLATAAAVGAQTPAIDFKDPRALAALQKDLASDDFATRDRAQRLLDQVPLSVRDDLAKLADVTTDPEAQARLRARLDQIDDIRVTDPPPISLEVKDATLAQVAAALAKATGQPIRVSEPAANAPAPADRYTLQADNLPFWEIHRQLAAQHPLWYSVGVNEINAYRDTVVWRDACVTRGTAVFLQELKAPPVPRAGATTSTRYTSTLGLGIDPRICILQVKPPEFAPVTDNAGTRWMAAATSAFTATIQLGRGVAFTRPITLEPAGAAGKTIPSLRGVFPVVLQSSLESKALDPAKDALDKPFTLGNVEITVTRCSATGNGPPISSNIQFDLTVHAAPGKNADPALSPLGPITVNILDATGKTVIVRTLPQGFIGSMSNAFSLLATPPITMRLDVTTAVREVKVPFDFKNVAIP